MKISHAMPFLPFFFLFNSKGQRILNEMVKTKKWLNSLGVEHTGPGMDVSRPEPKPKPYETRFAKPNSDTGFKISAR